MTLLLIPAVVFVLLGVLLWVGEPLWRGAAPWQPADPRAVGLLTRREAVLAALRDLDADHAAGRIADEDFRSQRAELVARGAATLEALDRLAADLRGHATAWTDRIEAEVAAELGEDASVNGAGDVTSGTTASDVVAQGRGGAT